MKNSKMGNRVFLSVCMITYNHERFIREAIEGVLKQEVNFSLELLIGEDFSTDNTKLICEEYSSRFPGKIRLLDSHQNLGIIPTLIRTLDACSGKYIAFCEGDDYWTDPLKLQKQTDFLETHLEYSMVCHNVKVIGDIKQEKYINEVKIFYTSKELASGEISVPALSAVFRNYDLTIPEFILKCPVGDFPLFVMISERGKIKYFPDVMGVRRVHAGGVWSAADKSKRLSYMLMTLYYMIGNYTDEVNNALIKHHLKLIAVSIKDGVSADYYPEEMNWVVKIMSHYAKIKKTLNRFGLLGMVMKIAKKSNKHSL